MVLYLPCHRPEAPGAAGLPGDETACIPVSLQQANKYTQYFVRPAATTLTMWPCIPAPAPRKEEEHEIERRGKFQSLISEYEDLVLSRTNINTYYLTRDT